MHDPNRMAATVGDVMLSASVLTDNDLHQWKLFFALQSNPEKGNAQHREFAHSMARMCAALEDQRQSDIREWGRERRHRSEREAVSQ